MRLIEAVVLVLIATIGICYFIEIFVLPQTRPDFPEMTRWLLAPDLPTFFHSKDLVYLAIGIIGATVMPHNLYLHSSIVQSRNYKRTPKGKHEAIFMANVDSALALTVALFVNAAIVVVAAAVFNRSGHYEVAAIEDAYKLLSPLLGAAGASTIFAIALLASGQNSSITGTLAGQVVMEGFIHIKLSPWLRRLITRSLAIIPTIIVVAFTGERGTEKLLLLSQVILSLQLSFAVIPLVLFTGSRKKMGEFVNGPWLQALSWFVAALIAALNAWFLVLMFRGN
jgi:manganese transport protein